MYKTISYDRSVIKDYTHNHYKGNTGTIKNIVDSFNSIFEDDPENMRYSAYEFSDDNFVQVSKAPLTEWVIPSNTKPYQKIFATNWYNLEYQMPAYFMQYISFAMKTDLNILGIDVPHPEFVNLIVHGGGFWKAKFAGANITLTKDKIIKSKPLIETPHFLESYYLISKKVSILDFNN